MSGTHPSTSIEIRNGAYHGARLYATIDQVQDVWEVVTEFPAITIDNISKRTKLHRQKVFHILRLLTKAGYISREVGPSGKRYKIGRTINIPLVRVK